MPGFWLILLPGLLVMIGLAQALAGWLALRRFLAAPRPAPLGRPGVTILKPLHGPEPLLEAALASMCAQDWADLQIVFGVAAAADPALDAVRAVQARFPARDIALVVDATRHGENGKIGNLLNMLPAAKHDVLVIADSDVHAAPDWIARLVATLEQPGIGLATTAYVGHAGVPGWVAILGAMQINHVFLPGALLGHRLGRRDCFGASMALTRATLARAGGLEALADELADDAVLGLRVARAGLGVALAPALPATTVPETGFAALWRHELRWARTVRSLAAAGHAASVLQYPLAWAALLVLVAGAAPWSLAAFAVAWLARGAIARAHSATLHRITGLATPASFWLLPLRDLISVVLILASFAGHRVEWRGTIMQAQAARLAPEEG